MVQYRVIEYISIYKYIKYINIMKKEIKQTSLSEYETKPVQLSAEAYNILQAIKNQLVIKHKKSHTFSDAVIELKNRRKGVNIAFTNEEVIQIKTKLKGGNK